jgi:chaperonin GroEL
LFVPTNSVIYKFCNKEVKMSEQSEFSERMLLGDYAVRRAVTKALQDFSKTVGSTAGPRGRLVAIRKAGSAPHLTKDGMTVAQAFRRKGFEGVAVDMVRQSSIETGRRAGDGTTTASVLAVALYQALADESGGTDERLVSLLEEHQERILAAIRERTVRVEGRDQLYGVTFTSCNGDHLIAEPITEAFMELGSSGAVTVEEDRSRTDVALQWINGTTFPAGFVSPYFVNDGTAKVQLDNPYIWFSLTPLQKPEHVIPAMQAVATANAQSSNKERRPLLIVCDTISDEALSLLLVNNSNGALPCCAVNSPYLGNMRVTAMRDLATICGATPTAREGFDRDSILRFMGGAEKVTVESKLTSLFKPAGDKDALSALCSQVEERLGGEVEELERAALQARLGALRGKAAVIKVGGTTHSELIERKDRADDALASARWALLEGILPGSGTTLLQIAQDVVPQEFTEAFSAPVLQVFRNYAGVTDGVEVPKEFENACGMTSKNIAEKVCGYDLRSGEVVTDLIGSGVIDSSYAVQEAVRAAISTALSLAKIRAIILQDGDEM